MGDYRLFFLGSDGAIEARQDFAAPDDDAALQIMAFIAQASSDTHHGVMLWQGTRRIFETPASGKTDGAAGGDGAVAGVTAATLTADSQQRALDCEEALLNSHWRLAKSQTLLQATGQLRRRLSGRTAP
ncbi:MAG TPA: hypothetical protein VGL83_00405 [Stellaceae bacterium]|jgi:hypothetical protein